MSIKAAKQEERRMELQTELDSQKSQSERNKLGQFATPSLLAKEVITYGLTLLSNITPIRFLDPAFGTGSFYSALNSVCRRRVELAYGFEIDPHYAGPSIELWKNSPLNLIIGDFTQKSAPLEDCKRANLLICNPPYVRHHHIESEEKRRLSNAAHQAADIQLSGLAGLYCYFMAVAHNWMSDGGIAGWLIPSEFMDVNYGRALKGYLLREVTLIHIHRFDPTDVQFSDALVSSAVVWFRKQKPPIQHQVRFSFGGTMMNPSISRMVDVTDLERADKWTRFPLQDVQAEHEGYRLGDLFQIKRGLATGDNGFFIMDESRARALGIPKQFLRPILPSSRYVKVDEIESDEKGFPLLDKQLVLLDCSLSENEIENKHPSLWKYLQTGRDSVANGYLCRTRKCWYTQEQRPAAPIVCTYIGRSDHEGRPFRFLLNKSAATATNVYLMLYPKPLLAERLVGHPDLLRKIWMALNEIGRDTLLENGRVYGGGMHKLEPKELANVPASKLAEIAGLSRDHWHLVGGL